MSVLQRKCSSSVYSLISAFRLKRQYLCYRKACLQWIKSETIQMFSFVFPFLDIPSDFMSWFVSTIHQRVPAEIDGIERISANANYIGSDRIWTEVRWITRLQRSYEIMTAGVETRQIPLLHHIGIETNDWLCDKVAPITPEIKTCEPIEAILIQMFIVTTLSTWNQTSHPWRLSTIDSTMQ